MPRIDRDRIGLAFDMQGCPNRCRHCWLGPGSSRTMSEDDVRWGVAQFWNFIGTADTPVKKLSVATWFREPDYSDDYRRLYDLEAELSDGKPARYELLSVWRLARYECYADWAKSVGPDTCQISFFGLEDTNDWFHRRQGAFDDALAATERLLERGMKPRWQLFLTTKLLPELSEFLGLADRLLLRERVEELGSEFLMFLHLPGPEHEARRIEGFRPSADLVLNLPESILAASRKHLGRELLWQTEAALYAGILDADAAPATGGSLPEALWLFVTGTWDVFSNIGTMEPWWCLGNLKREPVGSIIRRVEQNDVLGLQVLYRKSGAELAEVYGAPAGQKIHSTEGDLLSLYRGKHCEREWNRR